MIAHARATALEIPEPPAEAIAGVAAWMAAVEARVRATAAPTCVSLLVTPLGMPAREWIDAALDRRGVRVVSRQRIAGWTRVSTAIYLRRSDAAGLRRAAMYEAAWEMLFPGADAEAWRIAPAARAAVAATKPALRARLPNVDVSFGPDAANRASLHAFHLADAADAAAEARRLDAAVALLEGRDAGLGAPAVPSRRPSPLDR